MGSPTSLADGWSAVRGDRRWWTGFLVACAACAAGLTAQAAFLRWNETRSGFALDDPLLALFEPVDLSVPTFVVIYAGLAVGLLLLAPRPRRLAIALRAYGLTAGVRILAMALLPLDPPAKVIPLVDPLVASAAGGPLVRDLFFSGHVATLTLLALCVGGRAWRRAFALAALLVAGLTVAQHTHYAIDVLAAPVAAWACVRLARRLEPGSPAPA